MIINEIVNNKTIWNLLKKKRLKLNQDLLTKKLYYFELKDLINNSLVRNKSIIANIRLTFKINKTSNLYYFKSRQKLICLFSLSCKVPNKQFFYSRFYLNAQINQLMINNIFK